MSLHCSDCIRTTLRKVCSTKIAIHQVSVPDKGRALLKLKVWISVASALVVGTLVGRLLAGAINLEIGKLVDYLAFGHLAGIVAQLRVRYLHGKILIHNFAVFNFK